MIPKLLLAFVPVVAFLALLILMDSFKLVRPKSIAKAMAWGVIAVLICQALHQTLGPFLRLSPAAFSRYVAPLTEETIKGLFLAYLVLRRRIGFRVDAAQLGFAVGTGFALAENVYYLQVLGNASLVVWTVRGFGTAILHGATMAIFAMMALTASQRHPDRRVRVFLPGWIGAVAIHSAFNQVLVPPASMTALLLIVLSVLVLAVYRQSEAATRDWVNAGLDLDVMLLEMFSSDGFQDTRFGRHLRELRTRFPGPVVADMLCLLRIELELSVQAKAMVMAREAGVTLPVHPDTRSALDELRYLRGSIGRTGLLALQPIAVTTHRDDWHRHLLADT